MTHVPLLTFDAIFWENLTALKQASCQSLDIFQLSKVTEFSLITSLLRDTIIKVTPLVL
jgi:hypothetical protein